MQTSRQDFISDKKLFTQSTGVLKSISTFCSNCEKIDACAIACSKLQSAMQNLLEVITEHKEVALQRDSVGFSGKSLSFNNTCQIGSYNSETVNTAECFSVQEFDILAAISIYC